MSCTELGFDDDGNLRVTKSADTEETLSAPSSYDFTGYSGRFQVRASEDAASALLDVTGTATAAGSIISFSGADATLLLKKADLATLPENADDSDDPWVGVYEWVLTDPDSLTTRFCAGSIVVERGVVR